MSLSEISGIRPTRMELLRLRRRRALADDVLEILKKVMATLTATLFEIVREVPTLRREMNETLKEAYSLYLEATMLVGSRKIEEVSWVARPVDLDINMKATSGILFRLAQSTMRDTSSVDLGQTTAWGQWVGRP